MPEVLESGKFRLTAEEAVSYQAAAARVREACEIVVDLRSPITADDWTLVLAAHVALEGRLAHLDQVIAVLQTASDRRKRPA